MVCTDLCSVQQEISVQKPSGSSQLFGSLEEFSPAAMLKDSIKQQKQETKNKILWSKKVQETYKRVPARS